MAVFQRLLAGSCNISVGDVETTALKGPSACELTTPRELQQQLGRKPGGKVIKIQRLLAMLLWQNPGSSQSIAKGSLLPCCCSCL